jgi:transglutaminase 1
VDYGNVKIYALATVEETKQTWSAEDDLIIEKPPLDVQVRDILRSRQHTAQHTDGL